MLIPVLSRRTFLLASAIAVAGCVRREPDGSLRIGGGEHGGLYLTFADLLAAQLKHRQRRITVEAVSTQGSVENLARLRSGDIGLGLALADVAERDRATGAADTAPLAVARVYENYLQVVVRDAADIHRLEDLVGKRVDIGPAGSGAAQTSEAMFQATGLADKVDMVRLRLGAGLAALAEGSADAVVWSGGVPTPAISELDGVLPLRMLDIGAVAAPMSRFSGYPYLVRRVPTGSYAPPGLNSIGVPNLLLCRPGVAGDLVAAVVEVLARDAPHLVPPYVRGLQYLDPPSMIQTGAIPLHPAAVSAYRKLHG